MNLYQLICELVEVFYFSKTNFKVVVMKKAIYFAMLILFYSVFLSGTALADVGLDLGSASGNPGVEVQIPIFLSNYPNGPIIVATSNEITYDSNYLAPLGPVMGPAGQAAGKEIISNITETGLYIVGVLGTTDQNLKTPILDGIVAYVRFRIKDTVPTGTYILGNKPGCTTADGTDIPVSGTDGFIDVSGTNTTTSVLNTTTVQPSTTTTNPTTTTTTVKPTTTTTPKPSLCAAESIYGENAEETELLREYRDNVLSKTPDGQEFIKNYYKFSPSVTKLLEQRPLLKNRAKALIDSMLPGIKKKVDESNTEP